MPPTAHTHVLLRAMCDELGRCGVRHACTSPGSRNSPIVVSLVREPSITCWSHIDERCAGFFALGMAKAAGGPVVVTCTSGTAAANLAPAVIEASEASIPLIVLTADRPAELREVGAGQAIDQIKLYGASVRWFFELETVDATAASVRWIRQLACRAYWTALGDRPGPVHLNVPLREPLVVDGPLPDDPQPGRPDGAPWVRAVRSGRRDVPARIGPCRGVIVAGRVEGAQARGIAEATTRLSERTGWPLLADPLAGSRAGINAIAAYDLLLRSTAFTDRVRPELVVRVGDLPTSKPLRRWLASLHDVRQLAVGRVWGWQDPDAVVSEVADGDPVPTLDRIRLDRDPDPDWLSDWRTADQLVRAAIAEPLGDELSEPAIARALGDVLDPATVLFVGASMPIRDLETHLPAGRPLPRVLSNRGANGIDGTVSSAFGSAAVAERGAVLLIGDVAMAHDIGGLMAARRLGVDLTIVVINNDGGGIFEFLPVRDERDAFDQHIATAHGLDFEHAAALYGLGFRRVDTVGELRTAVSEALGATIIELRTDRARNRELHDRIAEAAVAALRGGVPVLSRPGSAASPEA